MEPVLNIMALKDFLVDTGHTFTIKDKWYTIALLGRILPEYEVDEIHIIYEQLRGFHGDQ